MIQIKDTNGDFPVVNECDDAQISSVGSGTEIHGPDSALDCNRASQIGPEDDYNLSESSSDGLLPVPTSCSTAHEHSISHKTTMINTQLVHIPDSDASPVTVSSSTDCTDDMPTFMDISQTRHMWKRHVLDLKHCECGEDVTALEIADADKVLKCRVELSDTVWVCIY